MRGVRVDTGGSGAPQLAHALSRLARLTAHQPDLPVALRLYKGDALALLHALGGSACGASSARRRSAFAATRRAAGRRRDHDPGDDRQHTQARHTWRRMRARSRRGWPSGAPDARADSASPRALSPSASTSRRSTAATARAATGRGASRHGTSRRRDIDRCAPLKKRQHVLCVRCGGGVEGALVAARGATGGLSAATPTQLERDSGGARSADRRRDGNVPVDLTRLERTFSPGCSDGGAPQHASVLAAASERRSPSKFRAPFDRGVYSRRRAPTAPAAQRVLVLSVRGSAVILSEVPGNDFGDPDPRDA